MIEKPWFMWLLSPGINNPDDPMGYENERVIERAKVISRSSHHSTEVEAEAAAIDALRKLKQEVATGWVACYADHTVYGPGRVNLPKDTSIRRIRIEDVEG